MASTRIPDSARPIMRATWAAIGPPRADAVAATIRAFVACAGESPDTGPVVAQIGPGGGVSVPSVEAAADPTMRRRAASEAPTTVTTGLAVIARVGAARGTMGSGVAMSCPRATVLP